MEGQTNTLFILFEFSRHSCVRRLQDLQYEDDTHKSVSKFEHNIKCIGLPLHTDVLGNNISEGLDYFGTKFLLYEF